MSEQKKGKKSKKRGLIIFSSLAIIVFMIVGITISSQISEQASTTTGTSIDLAFDNWVISGEGYNRYIEDMGDYIEIYDWRYECYIQAVLDFDSIVHGGFKFQVQTPDLSKSGAFNFFFYSGDAWIFNIVRYKWSAIWYFKYYGGGLIILLDKDTNWHNFEMEFELNGSNSCVSITVDGITKIDSMMFSTSQLGIDKIRYSTSSYFIPTLTRIKLESLIKSN